MRLIAYLPVKPFSGLYMCDLESSIAGRGLGWCDCAIHVLATGILIMARRIPVLGTKKMNVRIRFQI